MGMCNKLGSNLNNVQKALKTEDKSDGLTI